MGQRGFSLIELVVGIAIVGILSLALGTSFTGSMAANRIEGQAKELHTDLMNARMMAMQRNRVYFVQVLANSYQVFEDTNRSGGVSQDAGDTPIFASAKLFGDPLLQGAGTTVVLNTKGIVTTPGIEAAPDIIQFSPVAAGGRTPDYDCIEITQTRVKMGQWDGGVCNVK